MPGALAVAMALAVAEHTCGSRFERDSLENVLALPQARQPGRLAPVPLADGSLVIDDTYNANPASVRAAIDVAREVAALRGAKLHLVLGEMRELGPWSQSEHQKLSPAIAAADAASTSAICGDARLMLSDLPSHRFFESSEEAARRVVGIVGPGDVVLVKASRGVRAELVVDALSRQRGLTA
jgi:UDP-N-acetylmuramoyl-tripeptide--D-alanyl-D-alanine ligase